MSNFKIKIVFNGLPDTFCVNHGTLPYPSTEVERKPLLFETKDQGLKFINELKAQYDNVEYEVVPVTEYIPILRDKRSIEERNKLAELNDA